MPLIIGVVVAFLFRSAAYGFIAFLLMMTPVWLHQFLGYTKENTERRWFKNKLYGWGWVPATWQGWVVTAMYLALVIAFATTIDASSPAREVALMFVLPFFLLTMTFIRIAYRMGDAPRWRWGSKK